MTTLIITRGLPASGKTTWAKAWVREEPNRARTSRDDLREMLFAQSGLLSREKEDRVTILQKDTVKWCLKNGVNVVVDNTNLRLRYVREWRRLAAAHGADFQVMDFEIHPDEAIQRDLERARWGGRYVGADVIRTMAQKFLRDGKLPPIPDEEEETSVPEQYAPDRSKPKAIIVDIDGTLALMDGRSPYDLSLVHTDKVNEPVREAVRHARAAGMTIIFCSGREDSSWNETCLWLLQNADGTDRDRIFMRTAGDVRKDAIVKRELFDKRIRHNYNVQYVLDDRQQVVDMWRELGLTCFQVAPGDF